MKGWFLFFPSLPRLSSSFFLLIFPPPSLVSYLFASAAKRRLSGDKRNKTRACRSRKYLFIYMFKRARIAGERGGKRGGRELEAAEYLGKVSSLTCEKNALSLGSPYIVCVCVCVCLCEVEDIYFQYVTGMLQHTSHNTRTHAHTHTRTTPHTIRAQGGDHQIKSADPVRTSRKVQTRSTAQTLRVGFGRQTPTRSLTTHQVGWRW